MRHDEQMLKLVNEQASIEHFIELRELPFFWIPVSPKIFAEENADGKYLIRDLIDLLPFPRFTWMNAHNRIFHTLEYDANEDRLIVVDYYDPLELDKLFDEVKNVRNIKMINPPGILLQCHEVRIVPKKDNYVEFQVSYLGYKKRKKLESPKSSYMQLMDKGSADEKHVKLVKNDLVIELAILLVMFQQADEKGQNLVRITEQQPSNRKKRAASNSPSRYRPSHHFVYMDSPHVQSTRNKDGEITHHKRGHHKRAHWRKMTHPRYKNHPKFGKRIRIPACWVGPKEWVDDGKIYTVMDIEQ